MLTATRLNEESVTCPLSSESLEIVCCDSCAFYMNVEDSLETIICANPKIALINSLELAHARG